MKVLLAVDGSEVSLRAARKLGEMAQWFKQLEVHVVTVHPPVPLGGRASHVVGSKTLENYYREEEEAAVAPACGALSDAGITCTRHGIVSEIVHGIVHTAEQLGCELICMGTHGRGKIGTAILGSTAQKVLGAAKVPVLLVP